MPSPPARSFLIFSLITICVVRLDFLTPANARQSELNKTHLVNAARAGGDYLVRMQLANGSFHYYYNAEADRFETRTYNIVRHAGTMQALLDLYAATRDVRYLESARRAANFLKARFRRGSTVNARYVLDYDGKAKLGANGLALVALAKLIELDQKSSASRARAVRLASQILAMQRKDGSFQTRYRLRSTDPEGTASLYYPGEAILGLVRLFRLNGDKRLLDAARRAADFLIESQRQMPVLPPDAWLMQALEALYDVGQEKKYSDHILALAESMIGDQYTDSDPDGYAGGFGPGPPRSTPAASRAEGLVSAYRIARAVTDGRAARIAASLKASARFQLTQQFMAENSGSLPNAKRARGGFREGLTSSRIRIDFVQHNISSLIGVAATLY